jgi:hypothetical protein
MNPHRGEGSIQQTDLLFFDDLGHMRLLGGIEC